jgi:glycosyltransferase involved in cell wall biosynthesis
MPRSILSKETKKRVKEYKNADIVVGIPSYNNSRTIAHVIKAVSAGLAKHFAQYRCVIVNSDGGSNDGTLDIVKDTVVEDFSAILIEHPRYPVHKIVTPYHGIPWKGSAFHTIFEIASRLEAKACAVVDSDLRNITPEWVEGLLEPVVSHGFDFVAPLYQRHKYDGTITNSIVYPLTRALYGKRIRQPIGGEFGISKNLVSHFLKDKEIYTTDVARFGIDIWMTTTAVASGFKVCQSFLGAKIHDHKDPGADLSSMMVQVAGSVFNLMERYYAIWARVTHSDAVPEFGFKFEVSTDPVKVNLERMVEGFNQGISDLSTVWEKFLSPDVLTQLRKLAKSNILEFRFPKKLWVRIIYEFALAYHKSVISRHHILGSLTPLYLGRTAAFVNENLESTSVEVENEIERLCLEFEKQKPYFLSHFEKERL